MFNEQPKHIYNIALPASTANEVIEWFEAMEANGELAISLIGLVYDRMKSEKPLESPICIVDSNSEVTEPAATSMVNQGDFFDSLYDWQGSSSAAFYDEDKRAEKKVKKKMLYV